MNVRTSDLTANPRVQTLGLILIGLLTALSLGQAIVSNDYKKLAIWAACGLILALSLFILHNWRVGVLTFFVWILFEDFVRKWLGNEIIVYFAKDILIGVTYLSYFFIDWRRQRQRFQNPLLAPLLMMFTWACVQCVNPGVTNGLVPLLGMRMSFLYVPMLYLGYAFSRDERELGRFCTLTLSLALLISLLGIVQSIVGAEFLNPGSAPNLRLSLLRSAPGSNLWVIRPTSTFVDPGRYAHYLFVMVYLGFGLVGYLLALRPRSSLKLRLWVVSCWLVALVGLFVSGQRAAIVCLILSIPIIGLAYVSVRDTRQGSRRRFSVLKLLLIGVLGLYLMGFFFPLRFRAILDFYDTTINPTSQYSELKTRPGSYWDNIVSAYESGGVIGNGTGTASLGLQYIASYEAGQESEGVYHTEGGFSSVLWEWGAVGLCLWLLWSILLMVKLFQKVRELRLTRYYWFGVSVALYSFFLLFPWFYLGMHVYQQYVSQAFLWFLVGIVFRLPIATPQNELVRQTR